MEEIHVGRYDAVRDEISIIAEKLLACRQRKDWAGRDPYDALNNGLFAKFRILDAKVVGVGLTQPPKRSPLDFRRSLLVPKTQNPKGLALFLGCEAATGPIIIEARPRAYLAAARRSAVEVSP
jgi:hypothetical protein